MKNMQKIKTGSCKNKMIYPILLNPLENNKRYEKYRKAGAGYNK